MRRPALLLAALLTATTAQAGDWSDSAIGYRYGNRFAEPYNNRDIGKSILNLSYAGSTAYGSQFFNVDLLLSDHNDPASAGSGSGAREVYLVYRNTLDLGRISGRELRFGPVRGLGLTVGADLNRKTDAGYNSRKRMLVAGPTLMFDVPGFFNLSLLALWESNAPYSTFSNQGVERYYYQTHPMLNAVWGVPLGSTAFNFEGYANLIAAKGRDEFGGSTAAEANLDLRLMWNAPRNGDGSRLKLGLGYQFWRNKFGNDHQGAAGKGAFAQTPMLCAEYHF
ncbi:MAG TPA: hypothetical protein VI279_05115 [Rhodocyclaceae bacterium]